LNAVDLADYLEPVSESIECPERGSHGVTGFVRPEFLAGHRHGETCRQCIGDVVVSEEVELIARHERLSQQMEGATGVIEPRVSFLSQGEAKLSSLDTGGHPRDTLIVRVEDPDRVGRRVGEQQSLVCVVLVLGRISVQMIGTEIRKDSNVGVEARAVVQLE